MATKNEPMDVAESVVDTTPIETVHVLKLIKDGQQKHGLRHEDYKRYSDYCTRRKRRLRRQLNMTHQYKCVPRRKTKFQFKPILVENVSDRRFVEVLVYNVEQCWALGMELKYASQDEKHGRRKYHSQRRLVKAVKHAQELEAVAKSCPRVDALTKLEVQAYVAYVSGAPHLERAKWNDALQHYHTASAIYKKLSNAVRDAELKSLYDARIEELAKLIKVCEFNVDGANASNIANMVRLRLEEDAAQLELKLEVVKDENDVATKAKAVAAEAAERAKAERRAAALASLPDPVPAKPVFFDLAAKYIRLPESVLDLADAEGQESQEGAQQASGFTGTLKSLFWGSK